MEGKNPNILFIMTDQQSAGMMSCVGNPDVKTPNMDYLARHGVMFQNAYCTNPLCTPSRFSLMTGCYPGDIGLKSNAFQDEISGVPEYILENGAGKLLSAGGYQALYGGKEHLPGITAKDLGFAYFCEDERDVLAEKSAEYIRNYKSDKPFAMVASFINPHDICWMAIEDWLDTVDDEALQREKRSAFQQEIASVKEALQLPKGMNPEIFFECVCPALPANYLPSADEPEAIRLILKQREFKELARRNYTDERWRLHRYAYARLTEKVDAQIGRLLDALIESGQWDNTVIIFTSDHGDMDASHKMEHKTALYQECCRVPLIIKGIGKNRPVGRSETLVSNGLDCICTILDYAGIAKPEYLKGQSLVPIVEENLDIILRDAVVVESEFGIMSVDKQFKYVCYDEGGRREQFYDLFRNPGEMFNQIGLLQYQSEVERLRTIAGRHKKKPNILFFFTDQQRWDTVGCYNPHLQLTPVCDTLAKEGTKFEYAFTANPVCGPARAAIQTGAYPTETGCYQNSICLPENAVSLAKELNKTGYDTAYVGKWHLGGTEENPVPESRRGGYRYWMAADLLEWTSGPYSGHLYDNENQPVNFEGYRVDKVTDMALDYLENQRNPDKPFFLFLSLLEPHFQNNLNRFVAPDGYAELYRNEYEPEDLTGKQGDYQESKGDYYGMCKRLDENLGRLVQYLKEKGLYEDTVIVFTSDHGCHFRTRNEEYKRSCHESSIRIPLVLKGGVFDGGHVNGHFASLIDLAPTILKAAGAEIPESMQGRPLQDALKGMDWEDNAYIQISESQIGRAVRTKEWKLGVTAADPDGPRDGVGGEYTLQYLYYLEKDPYEQSNLVNDMEYFTVVNVLTKMLIYLSEKYEGVPLKLIY